MKSNDDRPYEELRRLTVEAAAKGRKATEIAEFCGVTLRTIHRWLKDFRNGRTGPPQRKHKPYAIDPQTAAKIAERIEKQPGITLAELKSDLQLDCTLSTIHNTLKRMGYSYKKNAPCERTTPQGRDKKEKILAQHAGAR